MINFFLILLMIIVPLHSEGASRTFADGFEGATIDFTNWSHGNSNAPVLITTGDGNGITCHGGSKCVRINWDGTVLTTDPAAETSLFLNTSQPYTTTLFTRFWIMFDPNMDIVAANLSGGPKIFKWGEATAQEWYISPENGNCYKLHAIGNPFTGMNNIYASPCQYPGTGAANSDGHNGTGWHKVEAYMVQGNPGALTLWVDGQLQCANNVGCGTLGGFTTSETFNTAVGGNWNTLWWASNWSGPTGCCDHDATNYMYIDDFEVYTDSNSGTSSTGNMADATITVGGTPDTTPPTDPSSLSATAGSTNLINLSWTASTDNVGVAGYKIERCTGSGCSNFSQVNTSITNSFPDTGLLANTTYVYRVRAYDAAGNNSGYSNTSTATTPNTFNIGETNILGVDDFGNTGLVLAQSAVASNSGTLTSLSFYITTAAGQMRLGVYSNVAGEPNTKLAETAEFTPVTGWNTQNLVSNISITSGTTYWLAYAYNNNALHFRNTNTGSIGFANFTYGTLPTTFPTPITNQTFHWSFYGIATVGSSALTAPTNLTVQ